MVFSQKFDLRFTIAQNKFQQTNKTKINHNNDNHIKFEFLYIFGRSGLLCVAPFISEKAFQSDHLLHAMSRFCIEWTMLWCTMRTVKHVTGHQWKHYKQRFETPFQKWIKRHVYSTPGLELSSKSTQHSLEKLFWNWWYSRNVTLLHWMDPCSSVPCGPTNM